MRLWKLTIAGGVFIAAACSANVKVEPVEVKPITMTIDVHIKVDRQLDQFFDFEEKPDLEADEEGAS